MIFEEWVPEMEEPMLNCKISKFLRILGFFLEFERGCRWNVRRHLVRGDRCSPNVRLRSARLSIEGFEEMDACGGALAVFCFFGPEADTNAVRMEPLGSCGLEMRFWFFPSF